MQPLDRHQLQALPAAVGLIIAARALGLGRTKAYELAKHDQFPCRLIRIGRIYRVPTAALLKLLDAETVNDSPQGHSGGT